MTINNEAVKQAVKNALTSKGFDLTKTSFTGDFIDTLVDEVLNGVKQGTVSTTVTGSSVSGGPVTGTGTGTIS